MSEVDDIVVDITRRQSYARAQAIGGYDITGDQAGRAIAVGRASGTNPNVVATDVDGYDEDLKRKLATQIISDNLHLGDYVAADPINAKVSQDDWATLAGISQKLGAFRRFTSVTGEPNSDILGLPTRAAEGMVVAAAKGFAKGFGEGPIGSWVPTKDITENRLASSIWATIGAPVEGVFRVFGGGIHGAAEGLGAGVRESVLTLTGNQGSASQAGRDFSGIVEMQMQGVGVHGTKPHPAAIERSWRELESTKAWLDQGREPPAGISPILDRVKAGQNELGVKELDEMLAEAQQSTTKDRDPDTFAGFIRLKDQGTIAIDGAVVLRLYGDRAVSAEDGLFGWVPGIEAQLEAVRKAGGDIDIPLGDFLAKIDPSVAKGLRDDTRAVPGGITKNESGAIASRGEPAGNELEAVKRAGALEPLMDRELSPAEALAAERRQREAGTFVPGAKPLVSIPPEAQARYNQVLEAIAREEQAWLAEKAQRQATREASAEWQMAKTNEHAAVTEGLRDRPDVAAERALEGLDRESLSTADLEDIASASGFGSAREMESALTRLGEAKRSSGGTTEGYLAQLAETEVSRRMTERAIREDGSLDRAKDVIASDSHLRLLSEEASALGNEALAKTNQAQAAQWAREQFNQMAVVAQSSDRYLRQAQKAGVEAEQALVSADSSAALAAKQRQLGAMMLFREARQLEREQAQFERAVVGLQGRKVRGMDGQYQDVAQGLLAQAGVPSGRSLAEIQASQAVWGYKDLGSFVEATNADGWGVAGAVVSKPIVEMTVGEFKAFAQTIDSLTHIGREVNKIEVAGEARDFGEWREGAVANIVARPRRDRESQTSGLRHIAWAWDAYLTRNEVLLTALDNGDPNSPLVQAISVPLAASKAKKIELQEKLGQDFRELNARVGAGWKKTLDEVLPNDWFRDPTTGEPFKLTRADMINIMSHWGNRDNISRFTAGWGGSEPKAFEAQTKAWIDTHATRADWDFVQGVWDIYAGLRVASERVYQNVSGTRPRFYAAQAVDTPVGEFRGGYVPTTRDLFASGERVDPMVKQGTFGFDYPNFNSPQGHEAGANRAQPYFVNFREPLTEIPARMGQVIHDIAYRDSVMNARRVLGDSELRGAIRDHYGIEYLDTLDAWVARIGREGSMDEVANSVLQRTLRSVRLNLIQAALPFNMTVALTPDLGNINPKTLVAYYADWRVNRDQALRLSKEIPNALHNMDRDFNAVLGQMVGDGRIDRARDAAVRWGYSIATTITQQVRSAVWSRAFKEARAAGRSEARAAVAADVVVREQFGSNAPHDLPEILAAGGEGQKLMTLMYGFFNSQYNRMRPIPGMISRGEYMAAAAQAWGTIVVGSVLGAAVANPAREDESWIRRLAKAPFYHLSGMLPFVREAFTYGAQGYLPKTPSGSLIQSGIDSSTDFLRWREGKPIKSGVRHIANAVGLGFGVPGAFAIGKAGQGLFDVRRGTQNPRDFTEWWRLLTTGEAKLKRTGQR